MKPVRHVEGAAADDEADASGAQYLTFGLAGEMFAVNVHRVREVLDLQHIAKLANAPPGLLGITDVRGAGIPIVDLKRKLGMPSGETNDQSRIVVLQVVGPEGEMVVGALTDAVYEVTPLSDAAVEEPPKIGMTWDRSFMLGIGRREGRFVTLLDLARVFAADQTDLALYG